MFLLLAGAYAYGQTPVSVFGYPYFDQSVTQTEIDNAGPVFSQQSVTFPATQNYVFNGNSDKEIRATSYIKIEGSNAGFKAGPYTGTGKMKLTVGSSPFDVAVMNYNGLNHVIKYEKLELGVALPTDILTKVNNFVNNIEGQKLNPFLEWELKVEAIFTHPNVSEPIVIDGFYSKQYSTWMVDPLPDLPAAAACYSDCYTSLGGYTELPASNYPFRIRFAPPQTGIWNAVIKITTATQTIVTPSFEFNVFDEGNPGYVKVGDSKRFLTLNGQTFVPIGCNAMCPETNGIHDTELAWKTHMNYYGHPDSARYYSEAYRPDITNVLPRVYDSYKNVLLSMVNNGANSFRTIMNPFSTEIEYEKLGDYSKRLSNAQEMDEILELAEAHDFYLDWNCHQHTVFTIGTQGTYWNWAFDGYCYKQEAQGSVLSFLTGINPDNTPNQAKEYYKQRLRYILARWGYSTNISILELTSEIDQFGSGGNVQGSSSLYLNNQQAFADWMVEMGTYIKSKYNGKIHILTSCYAGPRGNSDPGLNSDVFDVFSSNIYDFDAPNGVKHFNDNVSEFILNDASTDSSNYTRNPITGEFKIKPLMFSEMDPAQAKSAILTPSNCGTHVEEVRRTMWQSLFSGLAAGYSWDAWYFPELYPVFGQMRNFISGVDFNGGGWHPGASERNTGYYPAKWTYKSSYADNMGEAGDKKLDVTYLRSGDGNFVIGVITNKTYNAISNSNCFNNTSWYGTVDSALRSIQNVQLEQQEIRLKGLNSDKYYVNYFLPGNGYGTPIHSSDDTQTFSGGHIKLEYEVIGNETYYIIPFMARRKGQSWSPLISNEEELSADFIEELVSNTLLNEQQELASEIKIYPNPADEMVYVDLGDKTGAFQVIIESLDGRVCGNISFDKRFMGIPIANLDPATYVIKVYADGTLQTQQKMIKL